MPTERAETSANAHAPAATFEVLPGESGFGSTPAVLGTLLGSCIAITVWDSRTRTGGLSHALLPERLAHDVTPGLQARYVTEAVALLCEAMRARGSDPGRCEWKVFGGGEMYPCESSTQNQAPGGRNAAQAQAALRELGITPLAQHLGGRGHRVIRFDLDSGAVWLRHHAPAGEVP